jgi:hypothetical protein
MGTLLQMRLRVFTLTRFMPRKICELAVRLLGISEERCNVIIKIRKSWERQLYIRVIIASSQPATLHFPDA